MRFSWIIIRIILTIEIISVILKWCICVELHYQRTNKSQMFNRCQFSDIFEVCGNNISVCVI